jgi:hypothetical protein
MATPRRRGPVRCCAPGLECRHESTENRRRRHRCCHRGRSAVACHRDSLRVHDLGDPGPGRARNRLPADDRGLHQNWRVAVAERDAERRHAAGPERPRQLQSPDGRQRKSRHHAGKPVVGSPANHRTRHRPPGAVGAAAARARQRNQSISGSGDLLRRGGSECALDRSRHRYRRRDRIFQSGRPGGGPHRGHQRRRRDRRRPPDQDHRQRQCQPASAQIRGQGDGARTTFGAAEHSGRTHA